MTFGISGADGMLLLHSHEIIAIDDDLLPYSWFGTIGTYVSISSSGWASVRSILVSCRDLAYLIL